MIRWPAILLLLTTLLARAGELANQQTFAGIAEFNAAYQAWDGERFRAAAELFRRATTNAPGSSTNFYWLGVTEFHLMLQLHSLPVSRTNTLSADAAMDGALAVLNTAVKLEKDHAESHALLGKLYGMKIDGNFIRGLRFGPRVAKHQKRAMKFGAHNPRVRYLLGTCQLHTAKKPAQLREALETLQLTEKLFNKEPQRPAVPLEPRWGYSSCLAFIGRTYELLGQPSEAAAYYRKALVRHPANHAAAEGLARVTKSN